MSIAVITPPASFVSLALAKKHLRVEAANTDEDDLIQTYIDAACAALDGPFGDLQRAIGVQTLELRLDSFYAEDWRIGDGYAWSGDWADDAWRTWPFSRIQLRCPPLVSVESITYEDGSGADQVLTSSGWQVADDTVLPSFGAAVWPYGLSAANAVRIRYVAGYSDIPADGDTPAVSTVPSRLKSAALLMIASLYANREATIIDASRVTLVENSAMERLVSNYRVYA